MQRRDRDRRVPGLDAHRELVGELAEHLAHDLANRLAVARLTAEVLAARADLPPDLADRVATVVAATGEAGELVQQLSAVAGRRPAPPHEIDLARLVGELTTLLRSGLGRRPLTITAEATLVVADRRDVEEVVLRMVLGGRRGTVDDAVDITVAPDGDEATIVVHRPSDDRLAAAPLARVEALTVQSGGTLAEATEGDRCVLTVRLPSAGEPPRPLVPGPEAAVAVVLVVEDDPDLRVLVRGALEADGHRVHAVADARAALAHPVVVEGELDLLVTDVELPGASGLELAATLAERGVRVLVMSGHGEASLAGELPPGAVVLDKPFGVPELLGRAREALGG